MRMRARYSLVYEEIFECDCTPTSVSRNIIYFIYILIGPDRHGSKENPSHHSSATFIGSLPLLARSVLFSSSLKSFSLFSESLSFFVERPSSSRSLPRLAFDLPYLRLNSLLSFFFFFTCIFFTTIFRSSRNLSSHIHFRPRVFFTCDGDIFFPTTSDQ